MLHHLKGPVSAAVTHLPETNTVRSYNFERGCGIKNPKSLKLKRQTNAGFSEFVYTMLNQSMLKFFSPKFSES